VNLERALRAGDRLGGHIVQGHVDGVGTVRRAGPGGGDFQLVVTPPAAVGELLVEKGSVAVAGVSLTVAALEADGAFTCAIIPTTLEETTLANLRAGDPVNLEADVIGRYVRRFVSADRAAAASRLTLEKLQEHGYA